MDFQCSDIIYQCLDISIWHISALRSYREKFQYQVRRSGVSYSALTSRKGKINNFTQNYLFNSCGVELLHGNTGGSRRLSTSTSNLNTWDAASGIHKAQLFLSSSPELEEAPNNIKLEHAQTRNVPALSRLSQHALMLRLLRGVIRPRSALPSFGAWGCPLIADSNVADIL